MVLIRAIRPPRVQPPDGVKERRIALDGLYIGQVALNGLVVQSECGALLGVGKF
jgi:hypothetical protein